ncbi:helix-turn-helix domain-containing protein [Sphingobacterium sp.]|uniref:helix-turn-helix domain-containing protein n=1 Tax=Sphingobacterium sp. TaxID=341027 RepID=UPI00289CC529|nr:helix-turn-helix domain-containing protein [Sphingobacterium sp.]
MANNFEKLREAFGGMQKSNAVDRFKKEKAEQSIHRKSQLIALKILRTLRQLGISQKEFSEKLGVSQQQVSKWVKGSENFTMDTIDKIEKVLGIQLIEIKSDDIFIKKLNIKAVCYKEHISSLWATFESNIVVIPIQRPAKNLNVSHALKSEPITETSKYCSEEQFT